MLYQYSVLFAGYLLEASAGFFDIGKVYTIGRVYTSYEIDITDKVIPKYYLITSMNLKLV